MGKSKKINRIEDKNIIQINKKKCIGCTACAFTCSQETKISVLKVTDMGRKIVEPKQGTFENTGCIYCGQCVNACPVEAISIRSDIEQVKEALDSGKYLVLISSPVVKVTLGEEFNLPIGTYIGGKIAPSAKKLGFNNIFDTEFGCDLTVAEEGAELIKRIANKENIPMFTPSCPAWINYAETFHPEILENISTAKSPQQMMGASIKTYFADTYNILPTNIFTVSVNSCAAKKYEAEREGMGRNNYKDVDVVLTVKEYADLLKEKGIDITAIPDEEVSNNLIGEYTGAGSIFGLSGGEMKAVIRSLNHYLNNNIRQIEEIRFNKVCEYEDIKEANIVFGKNRYKVAVINGLKEIEKFLNSEKWKDYLLIEVMTCHDGCANGCKTSRIEKKSKINENLCIACGTCIVNCTVNAREYNESERGTVNKEKCVGCKLCSNICRAKATTIEYYDKATKKILESDYVKNRINSLENIDRKLIKRISDENKEIKSMYKDYLGQLGSLKAISLLHVDYTDKSNKLENKIKKQKKH